MDITTSYWEGPMLGFDIESTGTDQFQDRIVTFSMIYSAFSGAEPIVLEWMIDPGVEIPEGASAVHGITTEMAQAEGMPPQLALSQISSRLVPIVEQKIPMTVFNAPFDTTMLWAEFERYGIQFPYDIDTTFGRMIDPLVIDKAMDKFRKGSRKLVDMASHYGYNEFSAHESTADVLATIFVARAQQKWFKPEMTIELLQQFQKECKAKQAASFQSYLRNKKDEQGVLVNPLAVINGSWPYETR